MAKISFSSFGSIATSNHLLLTRLHSVYLKFLLFTVKIPRTISSIIYKYVKRKYSCCDALQEIKRYPDGGFSPLTLSSPGVIPTENQS